MSAATPAPPTLALAPGDTLRLRPTGRPGELAVGRGTTEHGTVALRRWEVAIELDGAKLGARIPEEDDAPTTLTDKAGGAVARYEPGPAPAGRGGGGLLRRRRRPALRGGTLVVGEERYALAPADEDAPGALTAADGTPVATLRLNGEVLLVELAAPLAPAVAAFAGAVALRALPPKPGRTYASMSTPSDNWASTTGSSPGGDGSP